MTLEEIKKQEEMYVMHTYNRFPIASRNADYRNIETFPVMGR